MATFRMARKVILIVLLAGCFSLPAQGQNLSISLDKVVGGFSQPVHITHAGDGSGRLFVVEQVGRIRIVRSGVLQAVPFLDISGRVLFGGERGLLSVAFPPQFNNSHFYVYYTNLAGDNVLARYFVTADPDVADSNSEVILRIFSHPVFENHNGGQLAFGPDGLLYIGTGDGGSGGDPNNNAQNPLSFLGKILRIDVESVLNPRVDTYVIPPTNPFVANPAFLPEIWAWGLRNPFRFSFDRSTGDLYVGDVGQNLFEEVDFQPAASPGGENYGWDIMEGLSCFNELDFNTPLTTCNQVGLTLPVPVAVYDHSQGDCSVTGGFVYRGSLHPRLQGVYFYADFCTGKIWGLQNAGTAPQNTFILDTAFNISSFGEDEAGEVYLTDYSTGDIYRISTFADIPVTHFAFRQIESVFSSGITAGCSSNPLSFCPDDPITRAEMAVFIETSLGNPANACTGRFGDVPLTNPFCGFIERLSGDGITSGCGGGNFCPDAPVTRAEMAVFVEAAIRNPANVCAGNAFTDVTATTVGGTFCGFIERLGADGITGGCTSTTFCPNNPVTRAQMAVFLVAAPPPLTP